jgi:hypothetical protein
VHQRLWADAEDFERAMTYLKNDLDSDIGKSVYSIWLGAGFERGGDQRYGGLVWCDWAKLDPPQGLKQICGHTPAKTVRFKHGSDVVCLDTALKDYAIWDGENLEVKHFGRTTTDAKTD